MRSRLLFPAVALAAMSVMLSAQALDLRLGQWEYTINLKMPTEALAQLPPAARAQFQQPQTNKGCLTAEDLKELNLAKTDDDDCKVTSKKISGSVADIVMKCDDRTQTVHYEALSRESMRGTVKNTGGDGPSEIAISGKWVAAACKE